MPVHLVHVSQGFKKFHGFWEFSPSFEINHGKFWTMGLYNIGCFIIPWFTNFPMVYSKTRVKFSKSVEFFKTLRDMDQVNGPNNWVLLQKSKDMICPFRNNRLHFMKQHIMVWLHQTQIIILKIFKKQMCVQI